MEPLPSLVNFRTRQGMPGLIRAAVAYAVAWGTASKTVRGSDGQGEALRSIALGPSDVVLTGNLRIFIIPFSFLKHKHALTPFITRQVAQFPKCHFKIKVT